MNIMEDIFQVRSSTERYQNIHNRLHTKRNIYHSEGKSKEQL